MVDTEDSDARSGTRSGPSAPSTASTPRAAKRPRDAAKTRQDILEAAAIRFAGAAYSQVTLKDIADDVGVTPALVVRYFAGKRALFEEVVRAHTMSLPPIVQGDLRGQLVDRAREILDFFEDRSARSSGLALLRSLDLDDGELFRSEIERRILHPWSMEISGPDAEVRLRLIAGLLLGVGMFSLGGLTEPDRPPLTEEENAHMVRYLAEMLAVCLDP